MAEVTGRPDWGVLRSMMSDLRKATTEMPKVQKKMLSVTGTAWSADGMIKAVVGPRGHLMELEIDPRALRTPNSKALSAAILATVRSAVEEAGRQTAELAESLVPPDLRGAPSGGTDVAEWVRTHDADLKPEKDGDDV